MDALPHRGGHGWPRSPAHHDQASQEPEEGAGGGREGCGGGREEGGRGRAGVEMDHHHHNRHRNEDLHGGGGGGHGAPPPEGDAFEAERQRLRTEDRSSFGGRRSTVDTHDADAARSQGGAFLLGSSAPVHLTYHHRNSYEAIGGGGGMLEHHQHPGLQSFFAPYATTTSTQPSLHSHALLLHQSLPPPMHHFPMAAYHHQGLAAESGLDPHGHMSDDYAAAQFMPELEGAGEDSPDVTESSRQFLLRLAHKTGTDEGEVMPFIVKLEREWLIQKEQLRCLDEETFVARLGFPAPLAQSIREELSAGSTQVPNMLKYKVDQRQQGQHPQHHQSQHTPQPTQVAIPPPPPPPKEGGSSNSAGGGGKESTTGRKRKRLTLAEWVSKVEQFSLDTNHDPSPFRVASIYQVECYCCGYAVNMNKPGQLYYLKRHVEGVRPDVRLSNHFKNYKRWRQQYHPGEPVDLSPEKLTPAKRQKSGDDNDEGEDDDVEGEQGLDYATDEGIRRIRSHSPSQGRRADRETPPVPVQPRSALSKSLGASGEGEIEVEGEGSVQLRALDFVAPLRHSGSGPLHRVPQLPEHMMPAPFSTQLHPIPPTPSHIAQPQPAVSLGHLQFSQHHHYHLPPQPTFSAPLGHLPSYPSPPQQSQQLVDQYAATFSYGLGHPPQQQQQLHPQYPPVTHLRSFPPGAQHNERHS